jgi:hypothetical protein
MGHVAGHRGRSADLGGVHRRLRRRGRDADRGHAVSKIRVRLSDRGGGTRMEIHSAFESREDMEKWVGVGTVEGLQQAVGQMDALLAVRDS